MKKIFLIGLISLIFISIASAHPFIPETDYWTKSNFFRYISDDGSTEYRLCIPILKDEYYLNLQSISLVSGVEISVTICFHDKDKLENYIADLQPEETESFFHATRRIVIKAGVKPLYVGENGIVKKVYYSADCIKDNI